MQRSRHLALLVALAAALSGGAAARPRQEAAAAPRVAVFAMTSAVREVPAVALETAITDALVRESRYDVVARTQIDKVLAEQRLNNSDLVDPKQAVAVGKLLGANYVVTGSLLSASFEPGFFSKDEFRARAQLQVIDAETGKIVFSDTLTGVRTVLVMRRGASLSTISPAERDKSVGESLGAIADQFAGRVDLLHPLTGYVVKVDGTRVAINLGRSSGAKAGQEFLVYEEAEPIRDPVTGELLSTERRPLARLLVTSVEPKLSWTRLVVTHSPKARAEVAGERVDLEPVKGLVEPEMSIVQTEPRAAAIRQELDRLRRRR